MTNFRRKIGVCFKRNPSLGRYNGTRREWVAAYRCARVNAGEGQELDAKLDGIRWKAGLVVIFERDSIDNLAIPLDARIESKRLIDEIVNEAN